MHHCGLEWCISPTKKEVKRDERLLRHLSSFAGSQKSCLCSVQASQRTRGNLLCNQKNHAAEWERLKDRLNALPDSEVGDIKIFLFSHSIAAVPDSQGRILLPPDLTEYAEISKELAIVGVGDHVLIYSADAWREEEAEQIKKTNMESMRLKMREIGL